MQSMSKARLRKHADYQRVYRDSRKHFSASMSYFYTPRGVASQQSPALLPDETANPEMKDGASEPISGKPAAGRLPGSVSRNSPSTGPRVGLTAGRVLGKAIDRNRIKRRMREAVRLSLTSLTRDVDVILHPRRAVLTAPFPDLRREVGQIFSSIERSSSEGPANDSKPGGRPSREPRRETRRSTGSGQPGSGTPKAASGGSSSDRAPTTDRSSSDGSSSVKAGSGR